MGGCGSLVLVCLGGDKDQDKNAVLVPTPNYDALFRWVSFIYGCGLLHDMVDKLVNYILECLVQD